MSSSEDRLRERLKLAGAADDDITLALDEFRKRERQRCRLLQAKVKRLKRAGPKAPRTA